MAVIEPETLGRKTITRAAPVATEDTLPRGPAGTTDEFARRHQREIHHLIDRLQQDHPQVPIARIMAHVEQAYAELAHSRVQTYRTILAERAARRRLATHGHPPHR